MADERVERLARLTRPQRLFLKRAWAATTRRPLLVVGPESRKVFQLMVDLGLARWLDGEAALLTAEGHDLACVLARQGWPRCEKPRRALARLTTEPSDAP